jgi:HTH-type transcriptional regulator/antitoxin MqsA
MSLRYKIYSVTVDMPGWYSDGSDDGVHTPEDMKVSDRALRQLKVQADNLLSPEEIRRIRTKLGLTQRGAGNALGGGPNAFQKYESGEILPSRAISNFLRVLDRHPEDMEVISAPREEALEEARA